MPSPLFKPGTRRAFLQDAGLVSAGSVLQSCTPPAEGTGHSAPRFAYVGTASKGIRVFTLGRKHWVFTQAVPSRSPSALALHPNRKFLYAANEIDEHHGFAHGTVEAYAVDPHNGTLALLGRHPLSLSAIRPRSLAVSPDGRCLVVSVYGGGAYNVLPLEANGNPGRVTGVVKEIGTGPNARHQRSAHPHTAIFDPKGRYFVATDLGSDRLNVFTMIGGSCVRTGRLALSQGSGPGHLALHPSGALVYLFNELEASVSSIHLDPDTGNIRGYDERVAVLHRSQTLTRGSVAVHPAGHTLYTLADGIASWRIDSISGALTKRGVWQDKAASIHAPVFSPDAGTLFALDCARGKVLRADIAHGSGELRPITELTELELPLSLCLRFG